MTLSTEERRESARSLLRAADHAEPIPMLTERFPELGVDDAQAIQDELLALLRERGQRVAGYKMGLTSRAKMEQVGVDQPLWGFLTDASARADGAAIEVATLIHPRVEPEVAFVMHDALAGPDCSEEAVLAATAYLVPALEIIDSRYKDFRFDLSSVIADNTSAALFVVGRNHRDPHRPTPVELGRAPVRLWRNGELAEEATTAAVLGHPARSVAALVAALHGRGAELPAGAVVLTGAATAAVPAAAGDHFEAEIGDLGRVSARFV